jgi:hypothetical protein
MTANPTELVRREKLALEAIKHSLNSETGEFGATLFASHHIEELDSSYWQTHVKVDVPQPAQVIELLRLRSHWSDDDEDGIDTLDFGLPGDASDYLLSVQFDESGAIDDISMES